MADATHDPRAWRVATALAHATGLAWPLWAKGRQQCDCSVGPTGGCRGLPWCASAFGGKPVPAPWDTDAYLADCRRRGVEPGPLPSLDGEVDGGSWSVNATVAVIEVGFARLAVWANDDCRVSVATVRYRVSIDDLVRATNLGRVAAEAMR